MIGMTTDCGNLVVDVDDDGIGLFMNKYNATWTHTTDDNYPDGLDKTTTGCLYTLACDRWGADSIYPHTWHNVGGDSISVDCVILWSNTRKTMRIPVPEDIRKAFPHNMTLCLSIAALLHEYS